MSPENPLPPSHRRIHPLVAAAAVAIIITCLVGIAALAGWLPTSRSASPSELAQQANAADTPPPMSATGEPAPLMAASQSPSPGAPQPRSTGSQPSMSAPYQETRQVASAGPGYAPPPPAAPPPCDSCGRVESIKEVVHQAPTSGIGVAAGAVLGGVLGHQVGNGRGNTLATLAGAVGGGYAGNEVEKRRRTSLSYQVVVRMENGRTRFFPEPNPNNWRTGEPVRVVENHLEHAN
jgi:outer membrane lipoprotein SlyB